MVVVCDVIAVQSLKFNTLLIFFYFLRLHLTFSLLNAIIVLCILLSLCDRNILKLMIPLKKASGSIWRKLIAWSQLFDFLK